MDYIKQNISLDNIKPNDTNIVDVDGDGACLYRCMVNFLNKYSYLFESNQNYQELFKFNNKDISGQYLEGVQNEIIETELSKKIQEMIRLWVEKNIT